MNCDDSGRNNVKQFEDFFWCYNSHQEDCFAAILSFVNPNLPLLWVCKYQQCFQINSVYSSVMFLYITGFDLVSCES